VERSATVLHGTFLERPDDPHVPLRAAMLSGETTLPQPAVPVRTGRAADFPGEVFDQVSADLTGSGLAVVDLDEPAPADAFRAFGERLGEPMPERDPTVQPYVEQSVILNLRAERGHTADVSLAPFARNFLSLHSESSGRRVAEQPRHIVLMCCEPGDATAAQTVLVPMSGVAERLGEDRVELLAGTRYLAATEPPTIARREAGRTVFSFRDFMSGALEWVGEGGDADTVNAALRALLAAMYAPGTVAGVHWRRGRVVIIDNTFFFHGRTAGSTGAGSRTRHLKRLRVI
jgi:hypothetical protein